METELIELKKNGSPEKAWDYFKSKAFVGECPEDIDELVKLGFKESINEAEKYSRLLYIVGLVKAKSEGKLNK